MEFTPNANLKKPGYTDPANIQDINDNFDIVDGHIGAVVASDTGAHGLRYSSEMDTFEVYNETTGRWEEISSGSGLMLGTVTGIATLTAAGKVYVKWTDPEDLVVAGSTLASWGGTKLIRKAGSTPASRKDGVEVLDCKERNKYQNAYFCDSGLTDGETYYYKFFPYTTQNAYTDSSDDEFTAVPAAVPMGNVSGVSAVNAGNGKLAIKWTDPAATIVSDGVTLATWANTVVVVKAGGYATNPYDPDAAFRQAVTTRNQYASNPLTATGLTNGTEYYVSFFPVSTDGAVNKEVANRTTGTPNRFVISTVPSQSGTLTYNGTTQSPTWTGYDTTKMTLGGVTSGTNAESYTAIFTPLSDYCWSGGSIEPKNVTWVIGRASISNVPSQSGTLTYSGSEQSPSWNNYNSAQLTIGGDASGTNAGSYNATFTPTSNYKWNDAAGTGAKTVAWAIGVKVLAIPSSTATTFTYDGNPHGPSASGYDSNTMNETGTAQATVAGSYTVTYDLKDKSNYQWSDGTTTNKSISWTINRAKLTIPTAPTTTFTYNGNSQGPTVTGYNSNTMNRSGTTSSVNAGNFAITYSLKDTTDYVWSDGTQNSKTISWKINKAAGSLSLNKTSVELNASALTATVVVTRAGNGAITAVSSNTGVATVSVNGTNVIISNVNQKTGSATITVKVAEGTNHLAPADKTVAVTAKFMPDKKALNDTSWADIRKVSAADQGANYWSVGDRKAVTLNGTVGAQAINGTYYVYILGFNHNEALEGKGIHFGCFKTALSGGTDICLTDSYYEECEGYYGKKWFQMNHWSGGPYSDVPHYNHGGWAACNMRYDILGSTNQAPSAGANPTETCATNPVANTLMAALPADLRAVMQPMTKYTDNKGNSSNVAENVTKTIDFLPLLAEFEICGNQHSSEANQYEKNYQAQYAYYVSGNSNVKYRNSSTGSPACWWVRSPYYNDAASFCVALSTGQNAAIPSCYSYGLAPIFKV